jgi:hypothetical protein
MGIIELQKLLELVSFRLGIQADTVLHFRECCSRKDSAVGIAIGYGLDD